MIQCKSKQHAASASLPEGNIYLFYKLLSMDGGCRSKADRQGEKSREWGPRSRLSWLLKTRVRLELKRSHAWYSGNR